MAKTKSFYLIILSILVQTKGKWQMENGKWKMENVQMCRCANVKMKIQVHEKIKIIQSLNPINPGSDKWKSANVRR